MSLHDPNILSPPGANSDPYGFTVNSRVMLTAFVVIIFFVILMLCLHLYSRWYLLRSRRFSLQRAAAVIFLSDPSSTTTLGLDPSVIKSLPVFTFSAANATTTAMECAVCLSEFEESESGRVLPSCNHVFHVDCIDMWFHSHSSCPLCRAVVQPIAGKVKSAAEEVVITIFSGDDEGSGEGVGGAGSSQNSDRRKPEVPS